MSNELRLLLREQRLAQELSQDELARQLGISRQSIISLEQGAYLPSFPLLISMIQFFNCSLDELVDGFTFSEITPTPLRIQESINNREEGDEQMTVTKWDPFQAIDRMHSEMGDVVERTFGRVDWPRAIGSSAGAMNIHESDTEYEILMPVPGFKDGEINLEFSENVLTVVGEKKAEEKVESKNVIRREWEQTSFSRSVRFAHPISDEKIEAKLADGTLTITAPKVEPVKPKIKKIEVKK